MLTRLFPSPSAEYCTPYTQHPESGQFGRLVETERGQTIYLVVVPEGHKVVTLRIKGGSEVHRYGLPDRNALREYLVRSGNRCAPLLTYLDEFLIVPVFSLSPVEAIIKAIIRQVIRAGHARKLISDFVKAFGISEGHSYAFPSLSRLIPVSIGEYLDMGLGMKAEYIYNAVRVLASSSDPEVEQLAGVGPWTRAVVEADLRADFRYYPFTDRSGERIGCVFGTDVVLLAQCDPLLAADLYVYAASFLECN